MRLNQSQIQRLSQEMRLSPRLIQAMEILQLPMYALEERIATEMESNPVLEQAQPVADESVAPAEDASGDDFAERDMVVQEGGASEDFERLDTMTAMYGEDFANADAPMRSRSAALEAGDRKLEALANTPAPAQTLSDYLQDQWRFVETSEDIQAAGAFLIDYIDADGYLRTSLEDLACRPATEDDSEPADATASLAGLVRKFSLATLEEALSLVQLLEPIGVGARSLRECLLVQLAAAEAGGEDVSLAKQLAGSFLREIEMNRLPMIVRRTDKSIEEIKEGIARISHLNPRPGLLIGQAAAPGIRPDVIVDLDEDGAVVVTMADGNTPNLGINDYYRRTARDRSTERSARQFLQKNIRSAQWLIGAIAQRRHTIFRVTEEIFHVQHEYLEHGSEALRPLPMADVAEKVGVHVATVSRAVSGKYAQTPQGIVPLRMFFSGGTRTAGGEDVSWSAVQAKLREIVENEDKTAPLDDEKLAQALKGEGIDIARRTVAKYRGLLEIPPARKRREY